jgi:preprotein translocase subunit SecA
MNRQREIIYKQRRGILGDEAEAVFLDMLDDLLEKLIGQYCNEKYIDQWDIEGLKSELHTRFKIEASSDFDEHTVTKDDLFDWVSKEAEKQYRKKKSEFNEHGDIVLRQILLQITDNMWKDHLLSMDHLKEGIGMRSYAQKDPLNEYKKEGFELFNELMQRVSDECVKAFFTVSLVDEPPLEVERKPQEMEMIHGELDRPQRKTSPKQAPARRQVTPGRNQPCHCGSGKKYKNCCWKKDQAVES